MIDGLLDRIEYKQDDKNEEKGALECDNKSGADEAVEESQTKSTESKGRVAFGYSGLGSKKFSVKQGDHVTMMILMFRESYVWIFARSHSKSSNGYLLVLSEQLTLPA